MMEEKVIERSLDNLMTQDEIQEEWCQGWHLVYQKEQMHFFPDSKMETPNTMKYTFFKNT